MSHSDWVAIDPMISLDSQEILESNKLGIVDGKYLVGCVTNRENDLFTLNIARGPASVQSAIPPLLSKFDTYEFPPDLLAPAEPGSYDETRLERPYSTTCSCLRQSNWCIPVYQSSGERAPGKQVQHDQVGNRWWLSTDLNAELFTMAHNRLPGPNDHPTNAIPGTRSAERFGESQSDPLFWTVAGITVPVSGHFPFERQKRSGRYADPGFAYLDKLSRQESQVDSSQIAEDVLVVAFYAALAQVCERVSVKGRVALMPPTEINFPKVVEEVAARIAMRRGSPQPLPQNEDFRTSHRGWSMNEIADLLDEQWLDIWQGISNDIYYVLDEEDLEGTRIEMPNKRSVHIASLLAASPPDFQTAS